MECTKCHKKEISQACKTYKLENMERREDRKDFRPICGELEELKYIT
jgi:hypothetical protein